MGKLTLVNFYLNQLYLNRINKFSIIINNKIIVIQKNPNIYKYNKLIKMP